MPHAGIPATLAPIQPPLKKPKLVMTPSSQMCASSFTADSKHRIAAIGSTPPERYEHLIPAQVRDHFLCFLDSESLLKDVSKIVGREKLIDPDGGESFDLKSRGETTGEEPVQAIPLDQIAADKVFAGRVSTEEEYNDGLPQTERRNLKDLELPGGVATEKSFPDGYFHTNTVGPLPGRELPFLVTGMIETKGSESSPFRGAGEVVANASNAAVAMYKAGVPTERIVIPIVSFTGILVQFAAVYLLKPCFPVVCFLTGLLRFKEEGQEIAKHLLAMRDFTISTEQYIINNMDQLAQPGATETTITNTHEREEWMALNVDQHHVKDINHFFLARNGRRMSFNHFLRVTEPLCDLDSVCLPIAVRLGITKGPGKGPDCIIFEKLNGYKIGFPNASNDRHLLLATVTTAAASVHGKGIVHMDFYLSNIMWKKNDDGTFSVKLIDFDAAQQVGDTLTEKVLTRLAQNEPTLLTMLGPTADVAYDQIYLELYDQHLDDESLREAGSGEDERAVKMRLDARCTHLKKTFVEQKTAWKQH